MDVASALYGNGSASLLGGWPTGPLPDAVPLFWIGIPARDFWHRRCRGQRDKRFIAGTDHRRIRTQISDTIAAPLYIAEIDASSESADDWRGDVPVYHRLRVVIASSTILRDIGEKSPGAGCWAWLRFAGGRYLLLVRSYSGKSAGFWDAMRRLRMRSGGASA